MRHTAPVLFPFANIRSAVPVFSHLQTYGAPCPCSLTCKHTERRACVPLLHGVCSISFPPPRGKRCHKVTGERAPHSPVRGAANEPHRLQNEEKAARPQNTERPVYAQNTGADRRQAKNRNRQAASKKHGISPRRAEQKTHRLQNAVQPDTQNEETRAHTNARGSRKSETRNKPAARMRAAGGLSMKYSVVRDLAKLRFPIDP